MVAKDTHKFKRLAACDILYAALYYSRLHSVISDEDTLQRAISVARGVYAILEQFYFQSNGAGPHSREVNDAIQVLIAAKLASQNGSKEITLCGQWEDLISKEVLPRFTDKERDQLKGIGRIIKRECSSKPLERVQTNIK